jgi:hypothetical protein
MAKNKLKIEDFWGEQLINTEVITSYSTKEIEKITLGFLNKSIIITPVSETDEIEVEFSSLPLLTSKTTTMLSPYIGKKLGMIWNCTNLRGYFDMYIVGFEQLHPNILILCEGSALLLFEAHPFSSTTVVK